MLLLLAMLGACGSSQAEDWTHTSAVILIQWATGELLETDVSFQETRIIPHSQLIEKPSASVIPAPICS